MNTPYYIVYEEKLRNNLNLITRVMQESGAKIIMAFKANALWKTFPIFREYGICSTASSVNEMLLANDELDCKAHTYCPVYT
ncbi:MAG: carboxynorspermidine decarboxylase, partial [Bacteroidales bacterium]|nr:carboxynorspermidine decarboxylase [Candidatus Sodaliphilus fimicaballi]